MRKRAYSYICCGLAALLLAGCQMPLRQGLSAKQIAALRGQGFELTEEGWAYDLSGKVLFGSDVDTLNAQSRNTVLQIGKTLISVDISRLRIEGHTDASGSAAQNQQLSLRRANSVADVLLGEGIRRGDIIVQGFGSTKPVASNTTAQGRTENRRVAIVVPSQ